MKTNDSGSDKSTVECPDCGETYINASRHWSGQSCNHPTITDHQHEIIIGLLLGDGYINRDGANPRLVVETVCEPFMEWIDAELGILTTGVREQNRKTLSDRSVYRVLSRRHPGLDEYAEWYSSGKKQIPNEFTLTPLLAKVWYCCDGSLNSTVGRPYCSIAAGKKSDQKEITARLFDEVGFSPRIGERCIQFSADGSEAFLAWLGDPLPGFEYKWDR